ncbi:hypothetical protein D3C81_2020920 [compost metagenome]
MPLICPGARVRVKFQDRARVVPDRYGWMGIQFAEQPGECFLLRIIQMGLTLEKNNLVFQQGLLDLIEYFRCQVFT